MYDHKDGSSHIWNHRYWSSMRKITWTQLAGLLPLFGACAAFLVASAMGKLDFAQHPLVLSAAGLALIAGASLWMGAFGLLVAACFMSALSVLAPGALFADASLLFAIPALAGWFGLGTLILRRMLIGYRSRKLIELGPEIEKLRDRVHQLETLGFAGGMAEILGAASDAWSKGIQRVIDSGAALLAATPNDVASGKAGIEFQRALIEAQEGLAAQRVLTSQLKLDANHEATLADIVQEALALADEKLRLRGVEIRLQLEDSGPPFAVDLQLAAIALKNILENAAEASGRGGTIEVRAISSYRGERGVIEVEDKGAGLSQSVVPHIFKPFFSTRPGQLGLGLSVAREIAARMGGSISMSANEPRGVTFRLRVPMRRADVEGSTAERRDALKARGSQTRFSSGEYKESLSIDTSDAPTADEVEHLEDVNGDPSAEAMTQEDTRRREREEQAARERESDIIPTMPRSDEVETEALAEPERELEPEVDDAFRAALSKAKSRREEQEREEFRARIADAEKRLQAEKSSSTSETQRAPVVPAPVEREEITE